VDVGVEEFAIIRPDLPLRARPTDAVNRVGEGLVALYRFHEGAGTTIHDMGPGAEPLDLTIAHEGAAIWGHRSLALMQPTEIASRGAATKLIEAFQQTGEMTVELWIEPRDAQQAGPAPIVSLAESPDYVNFMLGQGLEGEGDANAPGDLYVARVRTTTSSSDAKPGLQTSSGTAEDRLTHLVYVREKSGAATIYLDAKARQQGNQTGELSNWSPQQPLTLGSMPNGEHRWFGEYRLLAFYNRALTRKQVQQNFDVGLADEVTPDADPADAGGPRGATASQWTDMTLLRGMGSERTVRFPIDAGQWKVKYKIVVDEPTDELFEVTVVPSKNPDTAQLIGRSSAKPSRRSARASSTCRSQRPTQHFGTCRSCRAGRDAAPRAFDFRACNLNLIPTRAGSSGGSSLRSARGASSTSARERSSN